MKREDLFLTREQCLHLQELGLDMSDACFCWCKGLHNNKDFNLTFCSKVLSDFLRIEEEYIIPTYTLQEALETLPKVIEAKDCENNDSYFYLNLEDMTYRDFAEISIDDDIERGCTMKESAYNLLVWCLENKYL